MKLTDIIALAKQGYKPADIKELLTMADPEPAPTQAPADDGVVDEASKPAQAPATTTQAPATTTEAPADDGAEDEKEKAAPDYKSLYEAEKKKRQEENRRRAADPPEPFDEKKFLQDIASMY